MPRRLAFALLAIALLLTMEQSSVADDALVKQFTDEYRANLPTLIERYVKNRKVRTVASEYRTGNPFPNEPLGSKNGGWQATAVSDGTSIRIEFMTDSPHDRGLWVLLRPGDRVELNKNKQMTGYVVTDHLPTNSNPSVVGIGQARSGMYLPFQFIDASTIPLLLDAMELQDESSPRKWDVISVTSTTWQGNRVKAVRVRLDQRLHRVTSYYTLFLDLNDHLIFRGMESEGKLEDGQLVKFTTELTYTPGPDGYPLPAKLESYQVYRNGTKIPSRIVEVKEYSRYTPSADEFKLAQFGLAEPALDAPARTPRKRYIWVFVVVGIACALIAGILYWRWRSPTQSPTPTPSSV